MSINDSPKVIERFVSRRNLGVQPGWGRKQIKPQQIQAVATTAVKQEMSNIQLQPVQQQYQVKHVSHI